MSNDCTKLEYKCSVILPVYNEELNIEQCLLRFSAQLDETIQVVVIDDGSIDNTLTLVNNFIKNKKAKNFKLITQDNQGAARARLLGIQYAQSEFIAFIDCDDAIEDKTIDLAISNFETNPKLDLVLFDYYSIDSQKNIKQFYYSITEWPITGVIAFENTIDHWGLHAFGIYRKDVILRGYYKAFSLTSKNENNINDDELIARCAMLESNLVTLSKGKYFYNNNQSSTTRRKNTKLYRMIYTALSLKKLISQDETIKYLLPAVNLYILRVSTSLAIKHFKWSKDLDNNKKWECAMAYALNEVQLPYIYNYTKKNYKLLFWSVLKLTLLKIRYGSL